MLLQGFLLGSARGPYKGAGGRLSLSLSRSLHFYFAVLGAHEGFLPQGAQYPLIKEYTFNYKGIQIMI